MRVYDRDILIVGDLHYADNYKGKHKDYLSNCNEVLERIEKKVKELNPSALVLLGDVVGQQKSSLRNRENLAYFCGWLRRVGEGREVISLRGNHDIEGYPEFTFLESIGLIKTAKTTGGHFDYCRSGTGETEIRYHLVDYGEEKRELNILEGASNIVLGHNNYVINGYTTWYPSHGGVDLSLQKNFTGVEMVVSGHIHNPSPNFYSTELIGGGTCMLFYPGCPTRPVKLRENYETCWYLVFSQDEEGTSFDAHDFELSPSKDLYYEDKDFIDEQDEEELKEQVRKEGLQRILEEMTTYRVSDTDILRLLDNIPGATEKAKEVAKKYLLMQR